MSTHNPKTHTLLEENPEYLADLVFDALLSRLQYGSGNRVVTLKSRLTHDQRKLVVNVMGVVCSVDEIFEYWSGKLSVGWLMMIFGEKLPNRFDGNVGSTFLRMVTYRELTLEDLLPTIPKEYLL